MRPRCKINNRDLAREGGSENNRSRDSKWFAGDEEPAIEKHCEAL